MILFWRDRARMEVLLHKVCGRPASRTMTLRAAGPEDAAAFYALQNEVRAAMPHPEQFVAAESPVTEEDLHRRVGWREAGGLLHPAGRTRTTICLYGHPARRVGRLGNADSAIVTPTTGATVCSGRLLEAALGLLRRHRGHQGHRQPGKSVQPQQRLGPAALRSSATGRCAAV